LLREESRSCEPDLRLPFDRLLPGGSRVCSDVPPDPASPSQRTGLDECITVGEAQLVAARVTRRDHAQRSVEQVARGCNVKPRDGSFACCAQQLAGSRTQRASPTIDGTEFGA